MPEILIGLAYNATTGRLDVEVIKGSHFKQRAAGRAPGKNFGKRKVLLGFASMGKGWYDGSSPVRYALGTYTKCGWLE